MNRNPLLRLLVPVGLVLAMAPGLRAQRQLHTVRGVVRDIAGTAVPEVEIILESPHRSARTDARGRFALDSVPEGKRRALVRRIGYLAVHPLLSVPQPPGDTLVVTLLPMPQQLPPLLVEIERQGIYGVVGDTGYHALPGSLVEVLGARVVDTTDDRGRFGFPDLKQYSHYMLRVSRSGYVTRLIAVDLGNRGREFSVFLSEKSEGTFDWASSRQAAFALPDLAIRLAMEPKRSRMTREELRRFGTMALCDIPKIRSVAGAYPKVIFRGSTWYRNADLCGWSADQIDLLEFGADPCREAWKSLADVLSVNCDATRRSSITARPSRGGAGYVVLWPRD